MMFLLRWWLSSRPRRGQAGQRGVDDVADEPLVEGRVAVVQ
jgi:hypothetical protein